jgi:hypothetical protein
MGTLCGKSSEDATQDPPNSKEKDQSNINSSVTKKASTRKSSKKKQTSTKTKKSKKSHQNPLIEGGSKKKQSEKEVEDSHNDKLQALIEETKDLTDSFFTTVEEDNESPLPPSTDIPKYPKPIQSTHLYSKTKCIRHQSNQR